MQSAELVILADITGGHYQDIRASLMKHSKTTRYHGRTVGSHWAKLSLHGSRSCYQPYLCLLLFSLTVLITSVVEGAPYANLVSSGAGIAQPQTEEAYTFLYRQLTQCHLPGATRGALPWPREQVAGFLFALQDHKKLTQTDKLRLDALLQYFQHDLPAHAVKERRRWHVMQLTGDDYRFALDLGIAQEATVRSDVFEPSGTNHTTSLLPHVYGQVGDNFAFSTDIAYRFLYGEIFDDLYPDEASYRQLEGDLQNRAAIHAYLKFRLPWFDLQIGQDNLRWGPGYHGSLLISDSPIAWDMIKLSANYSNIAFTAFTGILEDTSSEIDQKYISGHRIEGYFWERFGLGFSEVVVYGNRFEPGYLNPITIYLVNEIYISDGDSRSPGSGDNVLMSADMRLRPMDGLELYGELMVDDGNPAKDFHHWDTKFGILGGVYATDPFGLPDTDFHAEYAFVNQYAYTHENPVNVYKHFSSVIGHHIGADADNLWVELRHRFTPKLESVLSYELERHGEGSVDDAHPADAPKDDTWTPLSGITQSEHRLSIGGNYTHIGRYSLEAEFSQIWMQNMENQPGVDEQGQEVSVRGLYRF